MRNTGLISALTLITTLAASHDASACGGLFCSAANPVNQAAERIIFAQSESTVRAVIEIQYEGPSESFSWVLPVPGGEPVDVAVSSKQALDALQQNSNPRYNLQRTSACPSDFDDDVAVDGGFAGGADAGVESPVVVVAAGTVGPYDYAQIALDDALENPADAALIWLEENGYDVSNLGSDLLAEYLMAGQDLIAFRLTKGNDSGSIRPIALSWSADNPVIPIRPTQVAANEDMGILVWVLGESRAIPANFLHLELNEAKINWFNPSSTYNDVVIAAADEAGGQGFVTEQSTDASDFEGVLLPAFKEAQFSDLRTATYDSKQAFLREVVDFGLTFNPTTFEDEFYDGFEDVMSDSAVLPLREGATVEQFLACVECYFETDVAVANDFYPTTPYDAETDPIEQLDIPMLLSRLELDVVEPLRETQALFDTHATVTRFYTTLSPNEMDTDPVFDFNPDLAPVSNVHTAQGVIDCEGEMQVTLASGLVVNTNGFAWPIDVDDEMPTNIRILQLSTSGEGDVAINNTDAIAARLSDLNLDIPFDSDAGAADDDTADDDTADDDTADDDAADDDAADDDAADDDTADDDTADDDATDDDAADDDAADDDDSADSNDAGASTPSEASANDDGCGCRVAGRDGSPPAAAWFLLVPLAFLVRRRRQV